MLAVAQTRLLLFFVFVCGLMKLMCSLRVNEQCVMHTEIGK